MNMENETDRKQNLDFILRWLMEDGGESFEIPTSIHEKQKLMRALMNIRPPKPVSVEFLRAQDVELQAQNKEKGVVKMSDIQNADRDVLLLWQGDITRLQADAVVNAANAQMLGCFSPLHACIDNCIHSAAGVQLREECEAIMQGGLLPTSEAVITQGYNLPAKHVIHTVGPIIPNGIPTSEQQIQLADCYRHCLELAEEHLLQSIAFCCISTGVFRFPNGLAAEIAVRTVRKYLAEHPQTSVRTIIFNVFLDRDLHIYKSLLS